MKLFPLSCIPAAAACFAAFLAWSPAEAGRIAISHEDCARLVAYQPAPGVAYQPGEDVYGRPVAPADLPGRPQVRLNDFYVFDLAFQPLDKPEFQNTDLFLGTVVIDQAGRAYFNGEPLQSDSQAELSQRCRIQMARNPQ